MSDEIQQRQLEPSQSAEEILHDFCNSPESRNDISKQSTSFIAKLYSNRQILRNFIQTIIEYTSELLTDLTFSLKPNIFDILKNANVNEKTISSVEQELDKFHNLFNSLTSEHLRMKALINSGCFIDSVDYKIGSRIDNVLKQGHMIKQIVPVKAKYLPLRSVLQKVFSFPKVLSKTKLYMQELEQETEILENFIQGEFKSKESFPRKIRYSSVRIFR